MSLLPELKMGVYLSKLFYENERARNFLIKRYGARVCEGMTDILMGNRVYPHDLKKKIKEKAVEINFLKMNLKTAFQHYSMHFSQPLGIYFYTFFLD